MTNKNVQGTSARDAHTWRVIKRSPEGSPFNRPRFDVLAMYYTEEDGFLVFKDADHKAVYAAAVAVVEEVIRLRTDTILAVSEQMLKDIREALAEYAMRLELEQENLIRDTKGTDYAVSDKSIKYTNDKLKRLRGHHAFLEPGEGIAARRREDDPSSLEPDTV